jgi:hypothetical protein
MIYTSGLIIMISTWSITNSMIMANSSINRTFLNGPHILMQHLATLDQDESFPKNTSILTLVLDQQDVSDASHQKYNEHNRSMTKIVYTLSLPASASGILILFQQVNLFVNQETNMLRSTSL